MIYKTCCRNVHCAICNNATLPRLICLNLGPFGRFNWQQNFNTFSFAVLFDIGGDADDAVGGGGQGVPRPRCSDGELFDPFFKKCRNVVCGSDDEIFIGGRCYNPKKRQYVDSAAHILNATTSAPKKRPESTKATTTATTSTTSKSITGFATTTVALNSTTPPPPPTPASTTPEPTSTPRLVSSTSTPPSPVRNVTEFPTGGGGGPAEADGFENSTTSSTSPPTEPSREFLQCPKFALEASEYLILDGGLVFVERYERHLRASEYQITDGDKKLLICAPSPDSQDEEFNEVLSTDGVAGERQPRTGSKFGPGLAVVTFLGLGLSSVCCVLHLVAASMAKELRNLSGKNLLSLVVSLLGGYLSFLAAMFSGGQGDFALCYFLAVSIYFFFLSGFAWMLVIAVDIFRTLRRATTQLRLTSGSQWKRFAAYSACAWCVPASIVAAAVLFDRVDGLLPEEWRPGFASHSGLCWFGRKRALIAFFAAPFCLVVAANMVFFGASAFMVYDTTRSTKSSSSCGPRTNFRLYLRLAVVMGLTWAAGLLAGLLDNSAPAWYAFVVLNTLQGVFIFAFFTCNRKVVASVKERLPSIAFLSPSSSGCCGGSDAERSSEGDPSWRLTNSTKRSSSSSEEAPARTKGGPQSSSSGMDLYSAMRGKTMYTVSSRQVNGAINQKSFDGRYF